MTWLNHLSDGQYFWLCYAAAGLMLLTGWLMARSLWRLRFATLRHPAARPYDWAREDLTLRQAVNVHRRAS